MKEGKKNKLIRQIIPALLILSIIVSGSGIPSIKVAAEVQEKASTEVVEPKVVYEKVKVSTFAELFGVEAPAKDGYYFGGWYVGPSETTAIKYSGQKDEIVTKNSGDPDAFVYAKFVPSYMLNVKVQNSSELNGFTEDYVTDAANKNITKSSLRMIAGIDSTRYKEVGFHVFVNGTRVSKNDKSKYNETVYDKILVGTDKEYYAKDLFGMEGKLMIAKFTNIPVQAWGTSIYVRPYWVTFDGIEVRGNGKYIHMEDAILGYMTIPVNLQGLAEETTSGVVAGGLIVKYDSEQLKFVDAKSTNCMFDTVVCKAEQENGAIRFAAIEKEGGVNDIIPNLSGAVARRTDDSQNTYDNVNNMYVTLRFSKGPTQPTTGYRLNFEDMEFCDVNEKFVAINIWNMRY